MNQEPSGNQVIKAIDNIFQRGHKSKFTEQFQQSVSKEAQVICEYLGIESETQATFWAMLFGMGIQSNSSIDLDAFSMYLNTTVLRVFQFQKDFDELVKRKLVQRQKPSKRRRGTESLNYLNLYVPADLVYSAVNGDPLPSRRKAGLNLYEILDIVFNLFQQRDDGYLDIEELIAEIESLMTENKKHPFVRQILNYRLPSLELVIFLVLCQQFTEGYQSVDLVRLTRTLLNDTQKQINVRKEFLSSKTKLQQARIGLVDLEADSNFRSDKALVLTQKGRELFGEDQHLFIEQEIPKNKNIIKSSSISEKRLFFNEKEQKQITKLTEVLHVKQHEEMIKKLAELRYNSGLCALFHGKPGTGKTECILQIARLTGRDIFKVEISECRSKWYGESEKLIKGIFTTYRKLLDSSKVAPILFFNEIDAIFGTRKSHDSSSTAQTESAIIGILLNEMENFPIRGILLSASNLPKNLDKAFERRFLYKIYFDHPDANTRSLIWKEKLPQLSDNQLDYLSDKYSYTGGQIDNLVKKCQIELLFGRTLDLKVIEEFCFEETLENKNERKPIGFRIGSI